MAPLTTSNVARQRPLVLLLTFLLAVTGLSVGPAAGPAPALADSPSPLSVTMTSAPNPVASGSQLTYTINVVNTGGARVDTVKLEDQINGMTGLILTSTVGSCSQSFNQVSCSAGTLEGFQSWTVTIRGVVTAANGETLHNGATVTGTKSSQTFTSSTSIATLVGNPGGGGLADLVIAITAPASAAPNGDVTYKLTVNNFGSVNATDIRVVFTLPQGFTMASGPPSANCTSLFKGPGCGAAVPVGAGVSLTYDGGAVNAGANATITIFAKAGANAGEVTATAVVDPLNTIAESNNLNNTDDATTTVGTPNPQGGTLTILKTFVSNLEGRPKEATPGEVITYTLLVKNTAATRADSVSVVDTTQGLDAASITATTTKGVCTVAAPKVTCTQTSPTLRLEPQETMTVTIKGTVVASAGSLIINTATVNGNIKNKGHSNTSTATTIVKPRFDLTITQSTSNGNPASPLPVRAADKLVYEMVVGNSGVKDASGVLVRQPLPANILLWKPPQPGGLFNVSSGGFNCSIDAAKVVTCVDGTVPAESIVKISFTVIAPQRIADITTTATVDPNNTIPESDEANNTFDVTTAVQTGIDLTVQQSVEFNPVAPSGTLRYQLKVSNIGTQDTTGVMVRDTLPAGTRFRSARDDLAPSFGGPDASKSRNFTCVHDGSEFGGVVECSGGIIDGTYTTSADLNVPQVDFATITITLFAPAPPGLINNQVRVDPTNSIAEIREDNNINTLTTDVQIYNTDVSVPPLTPSGGVYNELHITELSSKPAGGNTGDPVAPSGTLIYTIKLENTGSDPAFNVRVRDTLAAGSTFVKAESSPLLPGNGGGGGFRCTESDGVVECMGGSLAGKGDPSGGDKATLTITIFAPTQPATITNEAIIDPENQVPEADETNNRATTNTVVKLTGGGFIELHITGIDDTPDPVATSGVLQYVITVANSGTDIAFNVKLRDTLPAGTTFISAVGAPLTGPADAPSGGFECVASGGVVDCNGGTLAAGGTTTVTIKVFAPTQPGTYTNQAIVDPDNDLSEANETNNINTCQTQVTVGGGGQYFDLAIESLTDGPDPVTPKGEVTYDIVVKNNGSDQAFNVVVRDVLPAGTAFVSATGSNDFLCSEAGGVVDCTGGTLPGGGGSATITIKVLAPNKHAVTLTNQARVDPHNTTPEANETNNSKTTTTGVQSKIDLQITNSGPETASQSSKANYKLTVKNAGTDPAKGVRVIDPLPVGLIPLTATTGGNFSCQISQNPVNLVDCTGDLAGGKDAVIDVQVFVAADNGTKLDNEAKVDPYDTIVESNEDNNSSTAVTFVGEPDLGIELIDVVDPVTPGGNALYQATVTNGGTAPANSAQVTFTLPSDLSFVSAAATNGFSCSGGGTVTCSGNLPVGLSTTIDLTLKVSNTATNPMSLTGTATVANDNNSSNNSATATTSVGSSGVDLTVLDFTDDPDPAPIGSTLTYTVVAGNTSTADASAVEVRVTGLPSTGVTLIGAAASNGWGCTPSSGQVDCTGNLAGGANTTITIKYLVLASATGPFNPTATIDPDGDITESNESNNSKAIDTSITSAFCQGCIELLPSILASPGSVQQNDTLTYSVTVGNTGDTNVVSPASVSVEVDLDDADIDTTAANVTVTASNGFICGYTAAPDAKVTCSGTLDAGQGTIITVQVKVTAASGATVGATATATLTGATENNPANNTVSASTPVVP